MNTQINPSMQLPWFKQPLVWMLIAIPASAVLACTVTIYLAVFTDDGLVADDYYKQGLAINRQLERDRYAEQMQLAANIDFDSQTGFVRIKFDKGLLPQLPAELKLVLRHATQQQRDNAVTMHRGQDDIYVGSVVHDHRPGFAHGIWHVELSNMQDEAGKNWRMSRRVRLGDNTQVQLQP